MRFYLDNDVDARVANVVSPPHECWSAAMAGRADADDLDQALYAQSMSAAIVTHDAEFTRWRKRQCIGQHVWLCVEQPDAAAVLGRHLDDIVIICERHDNVVIAVRWDGLSIKTSWD